MPHLMDEKNVKMLTSLGMFTVGVTGDGPVSQFLCDRVWQWTGLCSWERKICVE